MKTALKITGLVVAAAVFAVLAVAIAGIPAGIMNTMLRDRIERATGARVTFDGATRVGLFPLSVIANDVAVTMPGDNPLTATIGRVDVAVTLASLLTGAPTASSLTLTRPTLRAPLLRSRPRITQAAASASPMPERIAVEHLIINDGAVVLTDPVAKVEQRIDGISADAQVAADRRVILTGQGRLGAAQASYTMRTEIPAGPDHKPWPIDLSFDAPGLFARPLAAKADLKLTGSVLSLANLSGRFGDDDFNGWASADFAGKPVVKLDLDFPKLRFDAPQWHGKGSDEASWSTTPFDVAGLNYVDAQGKVSIADMTLGALRIAPAALDLTLASGALKLQATHLGVGGGEIDGDVVIDASGAVPDLSLHANVGNVRARPLLATLASFDRVDGRMTAKIALRGTGASPRAVVASVAGTAFTSIRDGEIVGVNLAQMIRSLTASMLSGWQEGTSETTDLTELSCSLRLENGQGSTSDLLLAGPLMRMTGAGNIDIVTETMAFRVEPKLVMTLQGQSATGTAPAASPVGLGVPVVVQGPWAAPRIYPEISGILDNPDAAYAQLRQMGQGLFGRDFLGKDLQGLLGQRDGSRNPAGQSDIGGQIGTMIQGLGGGSGQTPGARSKAAPMGEKAADPDAPSPMNDIMKRLFGR